MREKNEKLLDSTGRRGPDPRWIYPVRAEVKWSYRGDVVVLEYPKDFNRLETLLHRFLGGPGTIRRPAAPDEIGIQTRWNERGL
jgi:hypothetical protein